VKILVDARELGTRATGVGRYLLQLLERWAAGRNGHRHDIVLAAPAIAGPARALRFRMVETGGGGGTAWEQVRFPSVIRRELPDVVFSPAYTTPLAARVPAVVTIHDISFAAHPEWFALREGVRRRAITRASARKAAAVIAVSEFSAREIEARYGVPRSRIHVIHHGIAHLPRPAGVEREPLVLFVGSVFNRRHVPELMAAVSRLLPHIRALRLAIVGDNRTHPRQDLVGEADALDIRSRLELTDYAGDEHLAVLYARASVFVFVSDYEGFGLTPLEALAAGVPPIVADTAVAHETCGDAAVYVPPGDVRSLASAIRALLVDPNARARVMEAAPAVLARYSWERAAADTLEVLERAARQ
jgi:glycosyltransferase involved in cell wall biosynthesis